MEGTVTCFDAKTNEIIEIQHIVQDRMGVEKEILQRDGDTRTTLYKGASTTYESFGVECIAKRLSRCGIQVTNELTHVNC